MLWARPSATVGCRVFHWVTSDFDASRFANHPKLKELSMPNFSKWISWIIGALAFAHFNALAVSALQPLRDDAVIEVLPAITRNRPTRSPTAPPVADAVLAALAARQNITMARETGDTRYWGRAQAVLSPWWDRADAPTDLAVLQATVQQGRHEFDASRQVLRATLARTPGHAQGWLNLAALERLSAHYAQSLSACEAVARAGQTLYAAACRLETQSLQGQHPMANQGLQALVIQAANTDQRSWLLSLLAESEERAGRDRAAADAYRRSLALAPDLYTSIAYSDLLLRTGKPAQALQALEKLPETDAVLVRRACAWRRLGDTLWTPARARLQERTAELLRRGDDPSVHGRELALVALWLDDDPVRALGLARSNLRLQREPLDWWVALQSAHLAKDTAALTAIAREIDTAGMVDLRLTAWLPENMRTRSDRMPK